jgi:hypothetical protein
VRVRGLRGAPARDGVPGQAVAVQQHDPVDVLGQDAGRQQARDARPDDDGGAVPAGGGVEHSHLPVPPLLRRRLLMELMRDGPA